MTTPQQPEPTANPGPPRTEPSLGLGPMHPKSSDSTVHLNPRAPAPASASAGDTVRLGPQAAETVKLGEPVAPAEATIRLDRPAGAVADDVASATFLDPEVWGSPGPAPQDGLRRVGPGVPPQAAAVWHGAAQQQQPPSEPERRRRRRPGWLLPVAVLLAVLAYLMWQRYAPATTVTGVTVSTGAAGPACDGTAVVTATLETDGRAGTVRYRWLRSDGTDSGELYQPVPGGHHRTDVVLRWTFEGHGTMHATATLEVRSPTPRTAAASLTYSCP